MDNFVVAVILRELANLATLNPAYVQSALNDLADELMDPNVLSHVHPDTMPCNVMCSAHPNTVKKVH